MDTFEEDLSFWAEFLCQSGLKSMDLKDLEYFFHSYDWLNSFGALKNVQEMPYQNLSYFQQFNNHLNQREYGVK